MQSSSARRAPLCLLALTLAVAATPFSVFGITSAFWAILAGIAASFMAERGELLAYWRGGTAAKD